MTSAIMAESRRHLRSATFALTVTVLSAGLALAASACESDSNPGQAPTLNLDSGAPIGLDGGTGSFDAATTPDTGSTTDGGLTVTGNVAIDMPALGTGFDYQQGSYSLGWSFVANAAIEITALGFYDSKKDGLTASHPVGVYDKDTQVLLAQATVAPTDALDGYFRYAPLASPLTLTPGKTYVLVAVVGDEQYVAFNALDPGWTVNPVISYAGGAVNYGNDEATTLLYPDTFDTTSGDFGPNFKFATE